MSKIVQWFKNNNFASILTVFLILCPTIDLVTSLMVYNYNSTLTLGLIIKGIFLAFTLVYMFVGRKFDEKYKKITLIYFASLTVFFILFLGYSIYSKPLYILSGEIKAIVKFFYYPVITVAIFNIVSSEKGSFNKKALVINMLYYILVITISRLSGTYYSSYSTGKLGHAGWYHAANEVSAILGILSPIFIAFIFTCAKELSTVLRYILRISLFCLMTFALFQIGTKVAFLVVIFSVAILLFAVVFRMLFSKQVKKHLADFALALVFILLAVFYVPYSPVGSNLRIHAFWVEGNYQNLSGQYQEELSGLGGEEIDTSGISEGTLKFLSIVFSSRDRYFLKRLSLYNKAPVADKLLGMGSIYKDIDGYNSKLIEIDILDVYFSYGPIGFILYFAFIGAMLYFALSVYLKRFKKNVFDTDYTMYITSSMLSLGISAFAGHVFTAPAVGVYAAVVLLMGCSKAKECGNEEDRLICASQPKIARWFLAVVFAGLVLISVVIYPLRKNANVAQQFENEIAFVSEDDSYITSFANTQEVILSNKNLTSQVSYRIDKDSAVTLRITKRTLSNSDSIYFVDAQNIKDVKEASFTLNIDLSGANCERVVDFVHKYGTKYANTPTVYVENDDLSSCLVGRGLYYSDVYTNSATPVKSCVRSLKSYEERFIVEGGKYISLQVTVPVSQNYSNYFIVSNSSLIGENSEKEFVSLCKSKEINMLLTEEGNFYPATENISPSAKNAIVVSQSGFHSTKVRDAYEDTDDSVYLDLMENDLYSYANLFNVNNIMSLNYSYIIDTGVAIKSPVSDIAQNIEIRRRLIDNLFGINKPLTEKLSKNLCDYIAAFGIKTKATPSGGFLSPSFSEKENIVSIIDNVDMLYTLLDYKNSHDNTSVYDEAIEVLSKNVRIAYPSWVTKDKKWVYKYADGKEYYKKVPFNTLNDKIGILKEIINSNPDLTNEDIQGIIKLYK